MERINLKKYGFVRCPEEDFTDDGNNFRCYKYHGMVVSVSRYQDDAFICAQSWNPIEGKYLPYEIYSKLPGYDGLGHLNGIPMSRLTDMSFEALKLSIDEYIKAYKAVKDYKVYGRA